MQTINAKTIVIQQPDSLPFCCCESYIITLALGNTARLAFE
ncbi:MAG: hypothetical protein U0T68_10765 [Ferruginibacter sp.]